MRRQLFALVLVGTFACTSGAPDRTRCAEVNRKLAQCTGTKAAQLDCAQASDNDIERIGTSLDISTCTLLGDTFPLDGDPKSAACRVLGVGCVRASNAPPASAPVRFPLVLVNGIDSSPLFRYSDRITDGLAHAGHSARLATLTPYAPTRVRAAELWRVVEDLRASAGVEKVNLICHSYGGFDCRYLASPAGLAADLRLDDATARAIASVTTVATAHRGTRIADVLLGLTPDGDRAALVDRFTALASDAFTGNTLDEDTDVRSALMALSLAQAPAFNAEIVDAPGVYYQSWAGYSRPFGTLSPEEAAKIRDVCATNDAPRHDYMALPLVPFANRSETPNDGLCPVSSAKWGNFRGCIPADHMEQLGQKNLPDANVETGFDIAAFYVSIAADLAQRGF
jgi:triacylglycerol lipase